MTNNDLYNDSASTDQQTDQFNITAADPSWTPEPPKPLSDAELDNIVTEFINGNLLIAFNDQTLEPFTIVFAHMTNEQRLAIGKSCGCVYEYYSEIIGFTESGMPMFRSARLMLREDFKKLVEKIKAVPKSVVEAKLEAIKNKIIKEKPKKQGIVGKLHGILDKILG